MAHTSAHLLIWFQQILLRKNVVDRWVPKTVDAQVSQLGNHIAIFIPLFILSTITKCVQQDFSEVENQAKWKEH